MLKPFKNFTRITFNLVLFLFSQCVTDKDFSDQALVLSVNKVLPIYPVGRPTIHCLLTFQATTFFQSDTIAAIIAVVCYTAVLNVITQRFSPLTTLRTATVKSETLLDSLVASEQWKKKIFNS